MKPVLLILLPALAGTAAHAQFSLLPQAGFEQSRTSLNYGNGLSAADINGNFKAGLRADYRLKGGHSPFVNLTTSPSPVSFAFNNAGMLVGRTQPGNLQFRLEGGYQYSSKPIALGKQSAGAKSSSSAVTQGTNLRKSSCGSYASRPGCGSRRKATTQNLASNGGWNMRLQPSIGLAYIPSASDGIRQTGDGIEYTAASWKTALVPAMGVEFAKGRQRLLTLTVFYTKPLQQNAETLTYGSGAKAISVPVQTRTSGWGMTVGLPISFAKAPQARAPKQKRECTRSYYRRCTRMVVQ